MLPVGVVVVVVVVDGGVLVEVVVVGGGRCFAAAGDPAATTTPNVATAVSTPARRDHENLLGFISPSDQTASTNSGRAYLRLLGMQYDQLYVVGEMGRNAG